MFNQRWNLTALPANFTTSRHWLFICIIQHYLLSALKNKAHWTGSQHLTIVNYELWLNNSAQWCSQLAGGWSCPQLGIAPRLFAQVSSSSLAVAEIKIRFSAAASRLRYLEWQFFSHSVMDPIRTFQEHWNVLWNGLHAFCLTLSQKKSLITFREKKALVWNNHKWSYCRTPIIIG